MNTTTRKQREIQEREEMILGVAKDMLLEHGYLGMTMDRIAAECEYSKGTIYNHFPNKEEVVAALGVQTMTLRTDLFARASTFKGRSRERMMAIGEAYDLFVKLYPHHFQSTQILQTASIRDKMTAERLQRLEACDHRCLGIVSGIIRDGIAQGDLVLPAWSSPEQLTFGLWAMASGAHAIMAHKPLESLDIELPQNTLNNNYHIMLDGVGWQPLSHVWDYEQTRARIRQEVFHDAYRQLD